MLRDLTLFFRQIDVLQLVLLVGLLILAWAFLRAQKNEPTFNMRDLIVGTDQRVSLTKFGQFGCFIISSWAFVHLVIYDKLTTWYFLGYMLTWSGSQALSYWISKKNGMPDPAPKPPEK